MVNIIQIDGLSFNQILACFQVKEAELFKRRKGLKNKKIEIREDKETEIGLIIEKSGDRKESKCFKKNSDF